ncbi:MAG: tetratricopeptide repeat protein, partial [Planctomycetota bacterium]
VRIAKGDSESAQELLNRSLAIREKSFGPEHPAVLMSLNRMAAVYAEAGEHEKALALSERMVSIIEKRSGGKDPNLVVALRNQKWLLEALGRDEEAGRLEERIKKLRSQAGRSGPDAVGDPTGETVRTDPVG